jgi:hypothetical protein
MAESKQRKPPPIVVRTLVPREAPSPEDVLRKFLADLACLAALKRP